MLQPRRNHPQHEWIVIYTASNIPEAQIVAGRLQSEGIAALVNYPVGGSAMGIHLGTISVLVHPDDYQDAWQILFTEDDTLTEELPEGDENTLYDWQDFEPQDDDSDEPDEYDT